MPVSQQGENKEGQTHGQEGQRQEAGHGTEARWPRGPDRTLGGQSTEQGSGCHCLPHGPHLARLMDLRGRKGLCV